MIRKIKRIENIAIFKDFIWDSNVPEFKKYNAFYGWNRSGKTTITRFFSAFEKGELGKLELENDSICVIDTDNGEIKISKDTPIQYTLKNDVRVFNEDFVKDNLNWDESKASKILMIGKEQIKQKEDLERIIRDLTEKRSEIERKQKEMSTKSKKKDKILEKARDEVKNNLREVNDVAPKSGRATDYINYTVTDVENVLKSKESVVLTEKEFLQLKSSLEEKQQKDPINDIKIDLKWMEDIKNDSNKVFETTVTKEGLKLLEDLEGDERLKEWLRVGYELHKDKQHPVICEFCKNEILETRLNELKRYFSDVLRDLIDNIEKVIKNISQNNIPILSLQKEKLYSEFQNDFLDLSSQFYQNTNLIREELSKLRNKLLEKKTSPDQKIVFNFNNLNKAIKDLKDIVIKINNLIAKNNEKTNSFKEKRIDTAHKLELAIINKYRDSYSEIMEELTSIQESLDSLEKEENQLKVEKLNLEQKLREHHIAAEEFNKLLTSFLGNNEIELETVEDGYRIKREGKIANNLSEGEKNAIALIYFLIKLNEDNFNVRNGIIVIDDPVSSFDSQNIYGAFGFIKEKIKELNPQQVFIFTHNFPFFRLVRDWIKYEKNNFSFYMIKSKIDPDRRYSIIEKIDELLEQHNSEYTYLFKLIYQRAKTQDSSLKQDYIFPNIIRKFLENYISFKVPTRGVRLHKKFQFLCKDYPEIETEIKTRIESYCQDQSHPLYQDSPTDFDERLLGEISQICSAVINLIEQTDPKHYQHLLNECIIGDK